MEKICISCKKKLNSNEFSTNTNQDDLLTVNCKKCIKKFGYELQKMESENKRLDFIEALNKSAGNVTKACNMVNISRQTYYNWLDNVDNFKQNVSDVYEQLNDFVESKLVKLIVQETDKKLQLQAITLFLKSKAKDRGYVESRDFTVSEDKSVVVEIIDTVKTIEIQSDEEGTDEQSI